MNSTSKIKIHSSKVNKMGLEAFVNKPQTKNVNFMDGKLSIKKLTVAEVMEIQEKAKDAGENEAANFDILKQVISLGAEGGENLSDEDFDNFAIDDLNKLSQEIMKWSGVAPEGKSK